MAQVLLLFRKEEGEKLATVRLFFKKLSSDARGIAVHHTTAHVSKRRL